MIAEAVLAGFSVYLSVYTYEFLVSSCKIRCRRAFYYLAGAAAFFTVYLRFAAYASMTALTHSSNQLDITFIFLMKSGPEFWGGFFGRIFHPIMFSGELSAWVKNIEDGLPETIIVFIWISFALLYFFPVYISAKKTALPFSEEKNRWMKKKYLPGRIKYITGEEKPDFIKEVENGNLEVITKRERQVRYNMPEYALIAVYKYDYSQENTGYIGIENVKYASLGKNDYDINKFTVKEVVKPFMVGTENAGLLEQELAQRRDTV
jgi:hypothetical protein